jgi:formamidopyrimidine-DNA glycosylase
LFLTKGIEEFRKEHDLGTDALNLKEEEFLQLLEGKSRSIKGVLTDQHTLSGIGNVYSDEILYQCKIHPKTKTDTLQKGQKKQLFKEMREVLELAIDREGVRSDFPEGYLIRHRNEGEDCPKCKGKIRKIKISGRSTYFCPSCQKEK